MTFLSRLSIAARSRTASRAAAVLILASAATSIAARPAHFAQGDLLDRAVAAWANVRTAHATFEQTITIPMSGRTMTTYGEYQQERPGKIAIVFSAPANDRIVADGKTVWLYLPSSAPDQVIKQAQTSTGTGTVDLTAQFLTSPRTKYTVNPIGTMVISGRNTHGFNLIPKVEEGAAFKVAAVYIDDEDATIRQFEVVELSSLVRKVRLTSFKTNVAVDPQTFAFSVPKGARVIER